MPARPPETRALNQGYQYLTETRYGECEGILDKIRRAAQDMGMPVRSVEIEMGPSQFEFTFDPADPITIADMAVNFRTLVKEVCQREGLLASFMAKPKLPNVAANGWHIHQSIRDNKSGLNAFVSNVDGTPSKAASEWIAGLIANAPASCLLTSPTVNSYKRFAPYQLAPNKIGWGVDNRGAMIRALFDSDDAASRLENRVADSSANPYFALASQLLSGLDGLTKQLSPPESMSSPYDADTALLPRSLGDAIGAFESSELYRQYLGDEFADYLIHLKREEWDRYLMAVSDWEQSEYFTAF
jgi:glutamine synthetase